MCRCMPNSDHKGRDLLHFMSSVGWKPTFNAEAGGENLKFATKLQVINRLKEGVPFDSVRNFFFPRPPWEARFPLTRASSGNPRAPGHGLYES